MKIMQLITPTINLPNILKAISIMSVFIEKPPSETQINTLR